jgi:hypothetical protein
MCKQKSPCKHWHLRYFFVIQLQVFCNCTGERFIEALPAPLIGNNAFAADPLNKELKRQGIGILPEILYWISIDNISLKLISLVERALN